MIVYMKSSYYFVGIFYLCFSATVFILGMAAKNDSIVSIELSALFGPASFIMMYGYNWERISLPDVSVIIIFIRRLLDGYLICYLLTSGIMTVPLYYVLRAKTSVYLIVNMLLFIFLWLMIGFLNLYTLIISSITV